MRFHSTTFSLVGLTIWFAINGAAAEELSGAVRMSGPAPVRVPVILYHYVRTVPDPRLDKLGASLSVSPSAFHRQLAYLISHGYTPISPNRLFVGLNDPAVLPPQPVVLTFDDGTKDFATTVYPLLAAYGVPATTFVVPGFIGDRRYLSWEQIALLGRSKLITIGAHGLNHVSLTRLEPGIAERQFILSRNLLRVASGQAVAVGAYPNGAFNSQTKQMAAQAGYDLVFTTARGSQHVLDQRFGLPRQRAGSSLPTLIRALSE